MMKIIIFLFLTQITSLLVQAQTVSPSVIGVSGNSYSLNNLSISQTVGELAATKTLFNNLILNQGFQQGNIVIVSDTRNNCESSNILIYPQPANDLLYLRFNCDKSGIHKFIIYNLVGVSVFEKQIDEGSKQIIVNTSELPSGMYSIISQQGELGYPNTIMRKVLITH